MFPFCNPFLRLSREFSQAKRDQGGPSFADPASLAREGGMEAIRNEETGWSGWGRSEPERLRPFFLLPSDPEQIGRDSLFSFHIFISGDTLYNISLPTLYLTFADSERECHLYRTILMSFEGNAWG